MRAIVAFGLLFGLGVITEWEPLNGIETWTHWEWRWQSLGVGRVTIAGLLPMAGIALVLWRMRWHAKIERPWVWAAVAACSNFFLQLLTTAFADPQGLLSVLQTVRSPDATAYFTDAIAVQNVIEWLEKFHEASLHGHAATHPAGPILFYWLFLNLFEWAASAAFWGGVTVGLLGSATVIVMYAFSGLWTEDPKARLTACAFAALLPSSVVFFPQFDQMYPSFAMLLILLWVRSLNGTKLTTAAMFGGLLFLATFFAYNLLTIGAFLALYAGHWAWTHPDREARLHIVRCAVVALGTAAAIYTILWFITGYNAPAAFRHALSNQDAIQAGMLRRRYTTFVFTDLYDLALGLGIIAVPILLAHLRSTRTALTLIGVGTVLIVDLSGLLRGETARVWMFLMPLLVVPVALEIAKLKDWRYYAVFAAQWWIVVCVKAKMLFVQA